MKKSILLLALLLLAYSCFHTTKTNVSLLKKCVWYNVERGYFCIRFNHNNLVRFDAGDTAYYFRYSVKGNSIKIVNHDDEITKSKILKLTNDSLILDCLDEYKTKQVFYCARENTHEDRWGIDDEL